MKGQMRLTGLMVVALLSSGGDLLACGDKFLVGSRGTRFQRPKAARQASVMIYANPSAESQEVTQKLTSMLSRRGDRVTTVSTLDQLSSRLRDGGIDVVVTASEVADSIQQMATGAAVVIALDATASATSVVRAIDSAVAKQPKKK